MAAQEDDRIDAEELARRGRADPELLYRIEHRSEEVQADLEILQARDAVVRARSRLIDHVRGSLKPSGVRLAKCSAESFATKAAALIPEALQPSLGPLLELIATLSRTIAQYDEQSEELAAQNLR